jgi:phosphate transport system permease protein
MTVETAGAAVGSPMQGRSGRLRRRRVANWALWGACAIALALVVTPVVWILEGVITKALSHWHWSVLTTKTVGQGGGLANAIVGTLLIVFGVAIVAGVVGIAGGVYLAEYAPGRAGSFLRGASEVLAGIPSIVLGYVGYITLVVAFHWGFSLAAALIVLSIMVVPYIVKTTEVALRNVPTAYREGGEALGMRSGFILRKLVIWPALPGIATGFIVAMAIALGETAPLLYTAGWNANYPTLSLTHSAVGYLPYAVYSFYNYPYASSKQLSNLSALLLIVLVLLLIVVARIIVSVSQRNAPDRPQKVGRPPAYVVKRPTVIDLAMSPFRSLRIGRQERPPD